MRVRVYILITALTFLAGCRDVGETIVNGQTRVETNMRVRQPEPQNTPQTDQGRTFAKAVIISEALGTDSKEIVSIEHQLELKDENSKGIGVYIGNSKKAFLKTDTNRPKMRADFLEDDGSRYFVLASASASCGDAVFAVVKVTDKLDVAISQASESRCQGEYYGVNINQSGNKQTFTRQITIGDLSFNLNSFNWSKTLKIK